MDEIESYNPDELSEEQIRHLIEVGKSMRNTGKFVDDSEFRTWCFGEYGCKIADLMCIGYCSDEAYALIKECIPKLKIVWNCIKKDDDKEFTDFIESGRSD